MSQTIITKAFVEWKAQQAADNQPVTLDEFIFASVPDLDVSNPISNTESVPAADAIVYRQAVNKTGVVNSNSVVYSVTLGADVGDFDFNWIGLINKASGTLAMIIHAPIQRKVQNTSGQQGNVLVRSMLMEFSSAQASTGITTPAETWQIDFTARLAGMDETIRLAALDIYGTGAFFGNGFLVAKNGTQHFINAGLGYVGGLRAVLAAKQNIVISTKPAKVWVDVCYHGTLTSAYNTEIFFTVAETLTDYSAGGITHYVFALASIDANGVITDLRPKGSIVDQTGNQNFLRKDKNLADIADPAATLNTLNGVPKTRTVNKKALSGDIDLSPTDVGALPAGGTAVAASKLAAARKIAGVAFDGTTDINVSAANVGALPITGGTLTGDLGLAGQGFLTKKGNISGGNNVFSTYGLRLVGRSDDLFADIYHWESMGSYHSLSFHLSPGGGAETYYEFRNSGTFRIDGPNPLLMVGGANFYNNGDVYGGAWGGNLSGWLYNQFNARDANIGTRATWDWTNQNFSTAMRLGPEHIFGGWNGKWHKEIRVPNGYVVTGFITEEEWEMNAGDDYIICRPIQFYRNGVWITAEG
ncbi:MAG: phage tail protein [Rouxiella aceris]|uniref:phage tail-collar fiber domain-containing protein n=1 Tax=Rouxiella aceris TaxID=2703884 RepID=UPI00283C0DF9|nr:phage tail protein [Rouxiella aceris]MDR3432551.1 phage tail protein [Rouxiella aceris]